MTPGERAKRIRDHIPIVPFLSDLGYDIHPEMGDYEQQFSCDLHGDGQDNKPSARLYPQTQSWYCFACSKNRDVIRTVMDREGLSFSEACMKLEKLAGLSHPRFDVNPEPKPVNPFEVTVADTFQDTQREIERLIHGVQKVEMLPLNTLFLLWEVHDMVCWHVYSKQWGEAQGISNMRTLKAKVFDLVKQCGSN